MISHFFFVAVVVHLHMGGQEDRVREILLPRGFATLEACQQIEDAMVHMFQMDLIFTGNAGLVTIQSHRCRAYGEPV